MTTDELRSLLLSRKLITSPAATITALAGGVSCDIHLVEEAGRRFVVKRALPKLRVKDDWYADVNRNKHEQDYIDYVAAFLPEAMPVILHRDVEHGFFTMEFLGDGYENWKTMMLAGVHEVSHAAQAGRILGTVHRRSWGDPVARDRFDTGKNFFDLRIESYILTTGRRNPALEPLFDAQASRLASTNLCLVHGDYSPKNILISPSRMVVLDCEVAWFGDPCFDVAFLLNHLLLKAVHLHEQHAALIGMARAAWETYLAKLDAGQADHLKTHTPRLLLMLMMARVDGKSPAEYLQAPAKKALIRQWAGETMQREGITVESVIENWSTAIAQAFVVK